VIFHSYVSLPEGTQMFNRRQVDMSQQCVFRTSDFWDLYIKGLESQP
jgi:hypothetical protein